MRTDFSVQTNYIFVLLGCIALNPCAWAQTPALPMAKAKTVAHVSQASDGDVKVISDLVHAGNYAVAQQMTATLLVSYPHDPRLIKAKMLLNKLLAAKSGSDAAGVDKSSGASSAPLSGMDRVDYNALIQRARDAQQTTDLEQQKVLLRQFMGDSGQFLQKHPDQMLIWQLRAASALSLDDLDAGYEAGQKLLAAGAADSNDANLQQLMAQLKNKNWLDEQAVDKLKEQIRLKKVTELEVQKKYGWLLGRWSDSWYVYHKDVILGPMAGGIRGQRIIEFKSQGEGAIGMAEDGARFFYKVANPEEVPLPKNWSVAWTGQWFLIDTFSLSNDRRTMTMEYRNGEHETETLTKIEDAQSQ